MTEKNINTEVTEFELELAEYEGYKITCIIHGLEAKKLDIELLYSSELESESSNIRRLVTAIIVTALKESQTKKDNDHTINTLKQLKTFKQNPYTA